jgi:hypothetical protein
MTDYPAPASSFRAIDPFCRLAIDGWIVPGAPDPRKQQIVVHESGHLIEMAGQTAEQKG